jgi:hypothetical protein
MSENIEFYTLYNHSFDVTSLKFNGISKIPTYQNVIEGPRPSIIKGMLVIY